MGFILLLQVKYCVRIDCYILCVTVLSRSVWWSSALQSRCLSAVAVRVILSIDNRRVIGWLKYNFLFNAAPLWQLMPFNFQVIPVSDFLICFPCSYYLSTVQRCWCQWFLSYLPRLCRSNNSRSTSRRSPQPSGEATLHLGKIVPLSYLLKLSPPGWGKLQHRRGSIYHQVSPRKFHLSAHHRL